MQNTITASAENQKNNPEVPYYHPDAVHAVEYSDLFKNLFGTNAPVHLKRTLSLSDANLILDAIISSPELCKKILWDQLYDLAIEDGYLHLSKKPTPPKLEEFKEKFKDTLNTDKLLTKKTLELEAQVLWTLKEGQIPARFQESTTTCIAKTLSTPAPTVEASKEQEDENLLEKFPEYKNLLERFKEVFKEWTGKIKENCRPNLTSAKPILLQIYPHLKDDIKNIDRKTFDITLQTEALANFLILIAYYYDNDFREYGYARKQIKCTLVKYFNNWLEKVNGGNATDVIKGALAKFSSQAQDRKWQQTEAHTRQTKKALEATLEKELPQIKAYAQTLVDQEVEKRYQEYLSNGWEGFYSPEQLAQIEHFQEIFTQLTSQTSMRSDVYDILKYSKSPADGKIYLSANNYSTMNIATVLANKLINQQYSGYRVKIFEKLIEHIQLQEFLVSRKKHNPGQPLSSAKVTNLSTDLLEATDMVAFLEDKYVLSDFKLKNGDVVTEKLSEKPAISVYLSRLLDQIDAGKKHFPTSQVIIPGTETQKKLEVSTRDLPHNTIPKLIYPNPYILTVGLIHDFFSKVTTQKNFSLDAYLAGIPDLLKDIWVKEARKRK